MSNYSQQKDSNDHTINVISEQSSLDAATQQRFALLSELFIHNSPGKYFQQADGKYNFVNEVVTEQDVYDHLAGKEVLGIPLQFTESGGSFVKNIIIDLDLLKDVYDREDFDFDNYKAMLEQQLSVFTETCKLFEIPFYLEYSGFKGYHLHIFLSDYVPVSKARKLAVSLFGQDTVLNNHEKKMAWEIFPKSNTPGTLSQVKLPYALHRKSGKYSEWIGHSPEVDWPNVKKLLPERIDHLLSPLWSVVINCKAIRDLYVKVKKDHHLLHNERVALGTMFTRLEGGKEFLVEQFIRHCSDYDPEYTNSQISHMIDSNYKPMLCETMEENKICKAKCLRIKDSKSPVAFYYRGLGKPALSSLHEASFTKYWETAAMQAFSESHNGIVYSIHDSAFYKYTEGKYVRCRQEQIDALIGAFLSKHLSASDITNTRITDVRERLKKEANVQFAEEWNSNIGLINIKNGVLDIGSMKLLPHSKDYHFTIQLPFNYDPIAKAPLFENFLDQILLPSKGTVAAFGMDEKIILEQKKNYVLDWMCYTLFPTYEYQKVLWLYGEGRNGKGRLLNVWKKIVGDENVSSVDLHDLNKNLFLRANLYNKLVNFTPDLRISEQIDVSIMKQLSGGDLITADIKLRNSFQFVNYARLISATNEIPRLNEIKSSTMERIRFLMFEQTFTGNQDDTGLDKKLDSELSGIFNLVIQRLPHIRTKEGSFKIFEPDAIVRSLDTVQSDLHNVLEFAAEQQLDQSTADIDRASFYAKYKTWAAENGYKAVSNRKFGDILRASGYVIERDTKWSNRNVIRCRKAIKISSTSIPINSQEYEGVPTPVLEERLTHLLSKEDLTVLNSVSVP